MLRLISRNMKVFLRDKASVFFSFLSMIVIVMLYALFLGDMNVNGIKSSVGDVEGIRWLVDSWIMAGILVVNSITVSMGVFGTMVNDRAEKKLPGFLVTPIGRGKIVLGYLFSAWIIGVLLTMVSFLLIEVYIVVGGGYLLSWMATLKVLGLIVLNVFSGASILFFVAGFMTSANSFGALSTILGTMIGFVTGIYVPIGVLPDAVQAVIKFVPASHGTAMMRQVFMEDAAAKVFAGAPAGLKEEFYTAMGVTLSLDGTQISAPVMILVLIASGVLFLVLSALWMNRRKKQ